LELVWSDCAWSGFPELTLYVCASTAVLIAKASDTTGKNPKYEIWDFNLPPPRFWLGLRYFDSPLPLYVGCPAHLQALSVPTCSVGKATSPVHKQSKMGNRRTMCKGKTSSTVPRGLFH
jgi:hypothetical protein